MNDFDFDYDIDDEMSELRRRVERKREKAATNRLTKKSDFSLYLEESGPINLERELGFKIEPQRDWDE